MLLTFNSNGNEKQKEVYRLWANKTTTDIVYGGSKGSGKSYLGCSLIIGDCLMYPGIHTFIARKKLNDLRKFTIPSIHEVFNSWGITDQYYKHNGQDNFYEFHNGSKLFLLEAAHLPSDPLFERFGSMQMTRGWIEEAGEFEEAAKNNLFASVGRWKNDEYNLHRKLLQTCNPKKNYLYAEYYKRFLDGTLQAYKAFIQALPTDNKKLSSGYLEHLNEILTPNEKKRLLEGDWEYDDSPLAMFDFNDICNLFTNSFVEKTSKRYMSCDIAYLGADVFVVTIWDGFVIEKVIAIDKIDETAIGNKLILLAEQYKIPYSHIVYDADGLRKFTANSLKKLVAARPFTNNAQPIKGKNYGNLKTECAFLLKELIEANLIYCQDQEFRKQIIADLEAICREPLDDEGKIKLEKKSAHKLRTGRSPDFFDSLIMRMIFELKASGGWA
jgi:phage terminase large subunit